MNATLTLLTESHRREFHSSEWWVQSAMITDLKNLNDPELSEYIQELEKDLKAGK